MECGESLTIMLRFIMKKKEGWLHDFTSGFIFIAFITDRYHR